MVIKAATIWGGGYGVGPVHERLWYKKTEILFWIMYFILKGNKAGVLDYRGSNTECNAMRHLRKYSRTPL